MPTDPQRAPSEAEQFQQQATRLNAELTLVGEDVARALIATGLPAVECEPVIIAIAKRVREAERAERTMRECDESDDATFLRRLAEGDNALYASECERLLSIAGRLGRVSDTALSQCIERERDAAADLIGAYQADYPGIGRADKAYCAARAATDEAVRAVEAVLITPEEAQGIAPAITWDVPYPMPELLRGVLRKLEMITTPAPTAQGESMGGEGDE